MGRMGQAHAEFQGHELWSKTVGLVGLGAVGRAVARRLRPFGARVLVYDPYVDRRRHPPAGRRTGHPGRVAGHERHRQPARAGDRRHPRHDGADRVRADEAGRASRSTRPGRRWCRKTPCSTPCAPASWAAPASTCSPSSPPVADDPLLALPNVIATPHVGGNTVEVAAHQGRIIADDLRRMASGLPPTHVLNPETLAGFSWDARASARLDAALACRPGRRLQSRRSPTSIAKRPQDAGHAARSPPPPRHRPQAPPAGRATGPPRRGTRWNASCACSSTAPPATPPCTSSPPSVR